MTSLFTRRTSRATLPVVSQQTADDGSDSDTETTEAQVQRPGGADDIDPITKLSWSFVVRLKGKMHNWRRGVRNKMVMEATRGVKTAADVEDFELMDFEKAQKIRSKMSSTIQIEAVDEATGGELLDKYSYQRDGDKSFNTNENVVARERLKQIPELQQVISKYWNMCDKFDSHDSPRVCLVAERTYVNMHMRMQKALLSDFNAEEAVKLAHEEYASDLKRNNNSLEGLTEQNFFEGLFEIADLWTTEIDAQMYSNFLNLLFMRITDDDKWMSMKEIECDSHLQAMDNTDEPPRVGAEVWVDCPDLNDIDADAHTPNSSVGDVGGDSSDSVADGLQEIKPAASINIKARPIGAWEEAESDDTEDEEEWLDTCSDKEVSLMDEDELSASLRSQGVEASELEGLSGVQMRELLRKKQHKNSRGGLVDAEVDAMDVLTLRKSLRAKGFGGAALVGLSAVDMKKLLRKAYRNKKRRGVFVSAEIEAMDETALRQALYDVGFTEEEVADFPKAQLKGLLLQRTNKTYQYTKEYIETLDATTLVRKLQELGVQRDALDGLSVTELRKLMLQECQHARGVFSEQDWSIMTVGQLRAELMGLGFTNKELIGYQLEGLKRLLKERCALGRGVMSTRQLHAMDAAQLKEALLTICPGAFTSEQLASMTNSQLRAALRLRMHGQPYTEQDIKNMRSHQLRTALQTLAPGLYLAKKLQGMTTGQMADALKTRVAAGVAYFKKEISAMSREQLETALTSLCSDVFSSDDLHRMGVVELRKALYQRSRMGMPFTDGDPKTMTADQLRSALRWITPGRFTPERLKRMSHVQLFDAVQAAQARFRFSGGGLNRRILRLGRDAPEHRFDRRKHSRSSQRQIKRRGQTATVIERLSGGRVKIKLANGMIRIVASNAPWKRGRFRKGARVQVLPRSVLKIPTNIENDGLWKRAVILEERSNFTYLVQFMEEDGTKYSRELVREAYVRANPVIIEGNIVSVMDEGKRKVGKVTSTGSGFNFAVELLDGSNVEKLSRWDVRRATKDMTMHYYKRTSMMKGMSPLTIAVKNGDFTGCQTLLRMGEDPNEVDKSLSTPLIHAVWDGKFDIIELLVNAGADINVQNLRKNSAMHFAYERGHKKVIILLLEHGGKQLKNLNSKRPKQLNAKLHKAVKKALLQGKAKAVTELIRSRQNSQLLRTKQSKLSEIFGVPKIEGKDGVLLKRRLMSQSMKPQGRARGGSMDVSTVTVHELMKQQEYMHEMAVSTFAKFDTDGNGVLDKAEFKQCIKTIFKRDLKKWKEHWKTFNTDIFDGINFQEFMAFINAARLSKGYNNEIDRQAQILNSTKLPEISRHKSLRHNGKKKKSSRLKKRRTSKANASARKKK